MSDINVTPLVDVLLILVVALVITAPFLTQSLPVNLPQGNLPYRLPEFENTVLVVVDAQGAYRLPEGDSREAIQASPTLGLNELVTTLERWDPEARQRPVHIQMDEQLPHRTLVELMLALQKLGFPQVGLVFKDQGGTP